MNNVTPIRCIPHKNGEIADITLQAVNLGVPGVIRVGDQITVRLPDGPLDPAQAEILSRELHRASMQAVFESLEDLREKLRRRDRARHLREDDGK